MIAYGLSFLYWFSYFFVPALGYGLVRIDFLLIDLLFFMPLLLIALYSQSSRIEPLWGKETSLRYAISGLAILDLLFAVYVAILLI